MARLPSQIFRKNAVQYASSALGDVLRLTPRWTRWTYPMLVASFVAAAAYGIFGTLHEYAAGPALVWFSGRTHVTTTAPGTAPAGFRVTSRLDA